MKELFWNKSRCLEEAKKYSKRIDFSRNCPGAYVSSLRNNWIEEVCSHMKKLLFTYSFEECEKEALKYEHRGLFQKSSNRHYTRCIRKKWLDKVCSHMIPLGHKYKRLVYVYEFPDKSVYVGLTMNEKARYSSHTVYNPSSKSSVFEHSKKTGLKFKYFTISEYIEAEMAQKLEDSTVDKYRADGWNILNTNKPGSLGSSSVFWTKEKIIDEAKKYTHLCDFAEKLPHLYSKAANKGWIQEVCGHLIRERTIYGITDDKEFCKERALECKTLSEFSKKYRTAYKKCSKFGWTEEVSNHMIKNRKSKGYWTKEVCLSESLKYKTRKDFSVLNTACYIATRRNGWLSEACKHMGPKNTGKITNKTT